MVTLPRTRLLAVLGLSLALVGCSDEGGATPDAGSDAASDPQGIAPTVTSTLPAAAEPDVQINAQISATFSAEMDPTTLTAATFSVKQGTTVVPGTVEHTGFTMTFIPEGNLVAGSPYTATISTGVENMGGLRMASPHTWSFVTGTTMAAGPRAVGLGAGVNFAILAKTGVSTVPSSVVTGDIGVSPAAATYITEFSLTAHSTNVYATSTQVIGKVYAATYAAPTPINLTTAVGNMEGAYTDAASRPTPDFLELGTGNVGGMTLTPGLYKWTSTVTVPTAVTLNGGANDVWIFQTTGGLTVAADTIVTLAGGARAKNVFWQVAGPVTIGANAHFEGVILAKTSVTLQTGATLKGRAFSQTQVVLQKATVTQPTP